MPGQVTITQSPNKHEYPVGRCRSTDTRWVRVPSIYSVHLWSSSSHVNSLAGGPYLRMSSKISFLCVGVRVASVAITGRIAERSSRFQRPTIESAVRLQITRL